MELREKIKLIMKDHPGRLLHILGVESMAVKLAHIYGVDESRASIAALLHDVAKKMPLETLKELMDKAGYDSRMHYKLWHAYVGAYLAKEEYGIMDEDIIDAIKYHPTGHPNMSLLGEIIFVADWVEENTRNYGSEEEVRKIAMANIKRAVAIKLDFLMKKIPDNTEETALAYIKYKKYLKEDKTC